MKKLYMHCSHASSIDTVPGWHRQVGSLLQFAKVVSAAEQASLHCATQHAEGMY